MDQKHDKRDLRRTISFTAGIILFLAAFSFLAPTPEGLSVEGQRVGAMVLLMACWWIGEALPIGITALVPLLALPLMGALNAKEASAPYANHNIYLFMGGFFIAMAMQKWNLHRRMALSIVSGVVFDLIAVATLSVIIPLLTLPLLKV